MAEQEPQAVIAAMSGGVDSSVAALLLTRQGFEVIGATMRLGDAAPSAACGLLDDIRDAREACQRLGIEHMTLDFRERFSREVMDRFCAAYLCGQTPNPCIDCNQHLKAEALHEQRRRLGARFVATGHYARRALDEQTGRWKLLRAADPAKDQSYVLYRLSQDELAHTLFPLGDLTKDEVRELARSNGFENAEKQESQDICFVPDGDYASFIRRHAAGACQALFEPGDIVDAQGERLGQHAGLVRYTVGQRRGIGVAAPRPLYVKAKDAQRNRLVVAPFEELAVGEVHLRAVNVISGDGSSRTLPVRAKCSYRQQPVAAELALAGDGTATIRFAEPLRAPAPGQAAVCYCGDEVVAGGVIV